MAWLKRLLGAAEPSPRPYAQSVPCAYEDDDGGSWYVPSDKDEKRYVGPDGMPTLRLIKYQDSGGDDVLRLCEDGTGLLVSPSDARLPKIGVFVSQLRGEGYHATSCKAGDFSPGATVRLVPEPQNQYDPHAVAVYDGTGRHMAAYVNKQKARQISKLLAASNQLEAISIRGTRAGRACPQVAVLAARPDVLARLLSPRPGNLPTPAHLR